MLQKFRRLLQAIIPFRMLFLMLGICSFAIGLYFLLSQKPEYDKYLLPAIMLAVWCFCLSTVAWGYQFIDLQAPERGFFKKLGFKFMKGILMLAELSFLLTTSVLIWLSIRTLSFFLTY